MVLTALSRVSRLSQAFAVLAFAVLGFTAMPALAETADALSLEQRVDRLLWQLVNDERYSHLQVAANYERLRTQLLDQACLVSAAPCHHSDKVTQHGHAITTEITPEQEVLVEQLLFTIHSASASVTHSPAHLMLTGAE